MKRFLIILLVSSIFFMSMEKVSFAFWIWTPKSKTMINPKFAAKDTPREQYDWAMRFYKQGEFQRAAEEFVRLTDHYPDSNLAPDAQYYAGRSYEELGKYYFAFQSYQKTIENYPYTKRMDELIKREYNIAHIFETQDVPKLMDLELSISMDRAVVIYDKVVENSPFGQYAEKSLYNMGDCYRRMMKYKEAIEAYERIIQDYPESDLVPEAKYQLAYTKYEASLNPEYDQESTEQALEEFQKISRTSKTPTIAKEAAKMLDELKTKKAESLFKVAEFYERQGKYTSALLYYEDVVGKFADTDAAKRAQEKINQLKEKAKD
ncbi:outer membrane protein assembly factor BamD [Candidatus Omnitrophota bacterium]